MKDILDKLSSYNIFNYLLPGVLFAVVADAMTSLNILQEDIAIGVFVYYFLGSVISRIGSLLIEPLLLKFRIVTFVSYADFINASRIDSKLEVLSEANNMYRTICALMLAIGVVILYDKASNYCAVLNTIAPWVFIIGLFMLYLLSYKKQTTYITQRVEAQEL